MLTKKRLYTKHYTPVPAGCVRAARHSGTLTSALCHARLHASQRLLHRIYRSELSRLRLTPPTCLPPRRKLARGFLQGAGAGQWRVALHRRPPRDCELQCDQGSRPASPATRSRRPPRHSARRQPADGRAAAVAGGDVHNHCRRGVLHHREAQRGLAARGAWGGQLLHRDREGAPAARTPLPLPLRGQSPPARKAGRSPLPSGRVARLRPPEPRQDRKDGPEYGTFGATLPAHATDVSARHLDSTYSLEFSGRPAGAQRSAGAGGETAPKTRYVGGRATIGDDEKVYRPVIAVRPPRCHASAAPGPRPAQRSLAVRGLARDAR